MRIADGESAAAYRPSQDGAGGVEGADPADGCAGGLADGGRVIEGSRPGAQMCGDVGVAAAVVDGQPYHEVTDLARVPADRPVHRLARADLPRRPGIGAVECHGLRKRGVREHTKKREANNPYHARAGSGRSHGFYLLLYRTPRAASLSVLFPRRFPFLFPRMSFAERRRLASLKS